MTAPPDDSTSMRASPLFRIPIGLMAVTATLISARGAWQRAPHADLQVRTLEITRSRTGMSVRVMVFTDEARDAHLLFLLPVGVSVDKLSTGCTLATGARLVHAPPPPATVACDLGAILDRGFHEVLLSTTLPPDGLPRRFGVFAYSATPDPVPGNNYAERTIP